MTPNVGLPALAQPLSFLAHWKERISLTEWKSLPLPKQCLALAHERYVRTLHVIFRGLRYFRGDPIHCFMDFLR